MNHADKGPDHQLSKDESNSASRAPRFRGLPPSHDTPLSRPGPSLLGTSPSTPKRKGDDPPPFKARFKLGSSSELTMPSSSSPISRLPFRMPSSPANATLPSRDQSKQGEYPNTPIRPPKFAISSSANTTAAIFAESGNISSYLAGFSEFYPFFDETFCNFVEGGLMDTLREGVYEYSSKASSELRVSYRLVQIDVTSSYFALCQAYPISSAAEGTVEAIGLFSFRLQSIQKLVSRLRSPDGDCLVSLGSPFFTLRPEDGSGVRTFNNMYIDWTII